MVPAKVLVKNSVKSMDTESLRSAKDLSIAVVGSGYWGKNLVRNFHQLGVLRLICDKNEALLTQFRDSYPGVETCLALNDLLSRQDVHGIVIATPAETHYTLAREALLAGKHVYVEKPLVLREDEGEELISLANERRLVLMVGHLLRYHAAFIRLKEMVARGDLGRINYIYSHRLNLGKIRREENILWSFAPHDISMILALANEQPEWVLATGGAYLHQRIADVTTTHLEFPSGLRAHIFVSWLHPFKEQKLVVVGDRKMAVFDDTEPWADKFRLYPHEITWHGNVPVPARAEPERVEVAPAEPLRMECEHFLHCITNGQTPFTDGEEGLRVLRILNAGQRSLDAGGRRIQPEKGMPSQKASGASSPAPQGVFLAEGSRAHETAIVDDDVVIGAGSKVWHFSHILPGSRIGERCNIGQNVVIGPNVTIGNGCKIQNNVSVYEGIILDDDVFCGPSMVFTNVMNPRAHISRKAEFKPTQVKQGVTIGANATIVCGHVLGRYCFIGAGAVVTQDVPDHALMVGNPARQMGWMCACGVRLSEELKCPACGEVYRSTEAGLERDQ